MSVGRQRKWPEVEFWPGQLKLTALFLWKNTTGLITTIVWRRVMGWGTHNLVPVPNQGISSPFSIMLGQWLSTDSGITASVSPWGSICQPGRQLSLASNCQQKYVLLCLKSFCRKSQVAQHPLGMQLNHKMWSTSFVRQRCQGRCCSWQWQLWDIYLPWWLLDIAPVTFLWH